jgi:hypothetical protein
MDPCRIPSGGNPMDVKQIVDELTAQISLLTQVRNLLAGGEGIPSPLKKRKPEKKRVLSAEARDKIAAAQRKRWAAQRKVEKKGLASKSKTSAP